MCSRLRGSVLKTLHPTKLLAVCPVVCGCFRVRDDGEDVPGGAGLLYGSSTIALRHVRMPLWHLMLVRSDGLWASVGGNDTDGFARDEIVLET